MIFPMFILLFLTLLHQRGIWVFPTIMVPPNHPFDRVFHYKPSILGYPYFWKHPFRDGIYTLVNQHSNGTWTRIEDVFPMKNGDIPASYVSLPEGNTVAFVVSKDVWFVCIKGSTKSSKTKSLR